MLEQIINVFEVNTDAIATNKGFYYQYLTILKKWVVNFIEDNNIDAFTEVDQDIKEVGDNLLFTQVKCYTSSFSLNSEPIRNTIFDFFLLYLKNKDLVTNTKFCFATNTTIANKEKLLKKWIDDEELEDNELLRLCSIKIKEILTNEVKSKKNKKLSKNLSDEKRNKIKSATESFVTIVDLEVENFTKSIQWKFENLSPDEAIKNLKNEIDTLLGNPKFNSRPISLLFGVLISEIYKRSQSKKADERCLTKQVILEILIHSDDELENYLNIKFFRLLNIEIELIRGEIQNIQIKIDNQDLKISSLEKAIKLDPMNKLPRELNLLPDYNSLTIYDWDTFLNTVNSELNSKKLLSIFSEGGMGKSSFAKKYLKTFSAYDHIIWITVDKSIPYSFVFDEILIKNLNVEFSTKVSIEQQFKIILNQLNNIEGENLIIVDIQELQDDLTSLRQLISLSNWQKLILTRNHLKTIPSIKLPQIDIENAKSIFYLYYRKEDVDDKMLIEFIEFIDYNILVIELVAKTIENSIDLTLEQFLKSLKEQDLDNEEYNINIELNIDNSSIRIFNYLLKKFSFTNLNSGENNYLEFLSLLPSHDIVIEDIILINGFEYYKKNKIDIINMLNTFESKGLIEFTPDRKRINIHKIIKEVILYNERDRESPFFGSIFYIVWLTARIKEGQNNPSLSFKYLKYAQSILDNIKENYRKSIYQPLIMLENELLYSYRFFTNSEKELDKWIDLTSRAEKYTPLDKINVGVIYNNLGLAYAYTDYEKSIEQFEKAVNLFKQNEVKFKSEIITALNNISNVYLKSKDIVKALKNFKKIQSFRKKYNLYDDQQLVIEFRILAESYKICGDIKKAIEFMKQGIQLHYSLDEEKRNDFFLSACYNFLSQLYLLDNDLDLGILHQEKAISILEHMKLANSEYLLLMYQISQHLYKAKGLSEKEEIIIEKMNSFENFKI
jgi:hypothetical protein